MKQNLQFPDGKLAVKSINEVYADSNGNVTVDHVTTADAIGSTTATQVADTVNKAHTHDNKTTLDKLADASGKLTYNGSEISGTVDESRLLPDNPVNGDIPCFDATATIGGGNNENTKILLHFDTEIKDEAAGNAAPVTIITKSGTITLVDGGKFGKCAKFVTGSMTIATNLDELNANNWVVSGWFNPDADKHGVSYPTWLSMDDQNTHGFGFDSTGRYGESDAPLFYMDTPPTAGEWHWLAIVKYSGGLRFYLNGAFLNEIVASQMANFCSTLAIGGFAGTYAAGSTERTFSGLVDEVRLQYIPEDEISKWTGTSIAVPTEPYTVQQIVGEWNTINTNEIVKTDSIRLLPENPSMGDIACFDATATTGGGNDANTKLLLQPSTSDHGIVDQAAGNAAPVTLENHNVTVNEEGNMVFNGSGYLKIAANTLPADLMGQDMDYTIDILYTATSKSRQCLFGRGDSPRMDFLLDSNGSLHIGGGPNLGTGWPFDTEVLLTFECWKEDTVWRYTCYRDGSAVTSDTWGSSNWRGSDMWIGWEGNTGGRELTGQIKALRLSNTALHKGTAFSPDYPWTKPQTVGEWGLINKTSLVNSINGITPDDTGNVTLDLLTEEQLSKLNSIVLANDFTFTQSDIVSNMITKNATTLGVPAGSMVQVLSNTGIVMTERAGILVYWSGNNLIIDFTGYFNTTQTTLTGTWTVKFAGNFVGSGSGGSGTVAAIAYPIVLVKPAYTEAVHLEMVYATQDDYSDAQTLVNTKTTSADRSLVKAFGGTAWETCPSGGFGSVYDKKPVKIIVSSKLDATTIYNIKYRWISASSDTSISEWYGMVYPCYSVPQ